jgi:hypothetical protein
VCLSSADDPERKYFDRGEFVMLGTARVWTVLFAIVLGSSLRVRAAEAPLRMNFNEVKEVAPGVFFRYSSISATDTTVPFGGSNNIWVVFDDYVVVIDANFPKEAGDVMEAIKKTTDKPQSAMSLIRTTTATTRMAMPCSPRPGPAL